jgi:hypothetical protein
LIPLAFPKKGKNSKVLVVRDRKIAGITPSRKDGFGLGTERKG